MRVSRDVSQYAKKRHRIGPDDWRTAFTPTPATRRKTPGLPAELPVRLIRYRRPGFRDSWLVTSLMDAGRYTRRELIDLYHRRWSIETIYREWKHSLDIQNLRSHTPRGIRKEIHAQLMLSNLVRWLMSEAVEGTNRTPLEYSFLTALSHVKNALPHMSRARPTRLADMHRRLLDAIRAAPIRQRPGRSYPRPNDGKVKNRGHGKYKLPAKLKNP